MKLLPAFAACVVACCSCVAPFNIHAAAAGDGTVQLTPGQTRALFGDTLSASYYDASTGDYVPCTFTYASSSYIGGRYSMRESYATAFDRIAPTGSQVLIYQSDVRGLSPDQNYYSVRLEPVLSLGMLKRFSMVAGFSQTAIQQHEDPDDPDSPLVWGVNLEACSTSRGGYPDNYWSVSQNGNYVRGSSADRWTTNSNILDWLSWSTVYTSQTNKRFFVPNIIDLSSDSFFSLSDIQITRQGNIRAIDSSNAFTLLYITCPVLTSDYQDNSGGGNTGTDLTATNAKLDTIISILSLIASQQGGSGTDQDTEPSDSDSSVNQAADDYQDSIDDINDQFDILDQADSVLDNITFQEAQYTEMYDPVNQLIVVDPADQEIIPDQGGTPGTLPNAMAVINNEIAGVANPITVCMVVAAMIALISFVIFGKWG